MKPADDKGTCEEARGSAKEISVAASLEKAIESYEKNKKLNNDKNIIILTCSGDSPALCGMTEKLRRNYINYIKAAASEESITAKCAKRAGFAQPPLSGSAMKPESRNKR